jgi:peptidoglycan/LPS O-acetylase OafA/YrhL
MSNTTHSSLLEKRLSERSNYFNIVRLILAFTVCLDHAGLVIEGQAGTEMVRLFGMSLGYIAVNGFFVLSGLLICRSLDRSGLTFGYFAARLLRLYPALIVFALIASLIVAPIVAQGAYWSDPNLLYYPINVMIFGNTASSPPGFYPDNPYPLEYASPLWTLRYEFLCYMAAPLLILSGIHRRPYVMLALTAIAGLAVIILAPALPRFEIHSMIISSVRFGFSFLLGMTLWSWRQHYNPRAWHIVVAAALFITCGLLQVGIDFSATLLIAAITLWFGLLPRKGHSASGETDVSYGLYI